MKSDEQSTVCASRSHTELLFTNRVKGNYGGFSENTDIMVGGVNWASLVAQPNESSTVAFLLIQTHVLIHDQPPCHQSCVFTLFYGCVGASLLHGLCSGCGKRGVLLAAGPVFLTAVASSPAEHRPQGTQASVAAAPRYTAQVQRLWRRGLAAPQHVGSSQTRHRTRVSCIGRQIFFFFFNH